MNRRNFLKACCIIPALGLTPSIIMANTASTGAGLERIIHIIQNDKHLNKKVSPENIADAISCAGRMNEILSEAIIQTGAANDHQITAVDTREMNDYIFRVYRDEWVEIHGDDEDNGEETGFHKVRANGARTQLFGKNAINHVADSIYHLGFESHRKNRLLNEDGANNASYQRVAEWLDALLRTDLEAGILINPDITEIVGTTGTGLDQTIDIIYQDSGLQKRISLGDLREGADAANQMNHLVIEAIKETKGVKNGELTVQDVKQINGYLVEHYSEVWAQIHGDDEDDEETGFHKVQSDGAKTRLYEKNAVNKVFDGIYHLGFETPYKNRLVNEDGNKNASFKKVTFWLNQLLANDLN
ncbi:MAG TPA: hypothetical protein ENJ51_03160 [Leucothrix mucor]|uniref:Uncharacterized protein n=1 Tax=Leucothrix mucor TaxID=45248 RepID=A0A7V2WUH6_LEUMU|nr:hypothetical protein [Leucothrix mucor]